MLWFWWDSNIHAQKPVDSDGSAFVKGFNYLEGIIKHLLVFLAPNIICIGQLEKDIAQYLSSADQ